VHTAENGRAALDALEIGLPDLILLDLMMPEVDGFAFVEALRQVPARAGIPVVVLTAKDLTDADRERLNGGVERVLQKSAAGTDTLVQQLRAAIAGRAHPPGTAAVEKES
jgi:CheY-like chemotaxis protein